MSRMFVLLCFVLALSVGGAATAAFLQAVTIQDIDNEGADTNIVWPFLLSPPRGNVGYFSHGQVKHWKFNGASVSLDSSNPTDRKFVVSAAPYNADAGVVGSNSIFLNDDGWGGPTPSPSASCAPATENRVLTVMTPPTGSQPDKLWQCCHPTPSPEPRKWRLGTCQ